MTETVVVRLCRAVNLLHSLNEDAAVWGLATLNNELYVRYKGKDITVYDTQTYSVQCSLQLPLLGGVTDMTSCVRHQCVYIADHVNNALHRVERKKYSTHWSVDDEPAGLSVNLAYNVLVTCDKVGKIKEFTTGGQFVREINIRSHIVNPWHTVELTTGQFVVCHGDVNDALHRVCLMDSNGHLLRSYGDAKGSASGRLNVPVQIAVNGFIFVADLNNGRILMLDSALNYVREVITGLRRPKRICLDERNGRLYVADNKSENRKHVAGRVRVFSIHR
jgi:hypothetical protein